MAMPSPSQNLGAIGAPPHDPSIERWPVWARLAILIGVSAGLWAAIGWVAYRIAQLG